MSSVCIFMERTLRRLFEGLVGDLGGGFLEGVSGIGWFSSIDFFKEADLKGTVGTWC